MLSLDTNAKILITIKNLAITTTTNTSTLDKNVKELVLPIYQKTFQDLGKQVIPFKDPIHAQSLIYLVPTDNEYSKVHEALIEAFLKGVGEKFKIPTLARDILDTWKNNYDDKIDALADLLSTSDEPTFNKKLEEYMSNYHPEEDS